MDLLIKASTLKLQNWAIAAGSVRSAVWDYMHGFQRKTPPSDIDFVFYDAINTSPDYEQDLEESLTALAPELRWEPVNQATVHIYNGEAPYRSLEHAMSRWPETATAIGVYVDHHSQLRYYAPHGLSDLMAVILRPNLVTLKSKDIYLQRMASKDFQTKWPKITILMPR